MCDASADHAVMIKELNEIIDQIMSRAHARNTRRVNSGRQEVVAAARRQ
jgi:hypothetical protein